MRKSRIESEFSLYRKEVFDYQKVKYKRAGYKKEGVGLLFLYLPLALLILNFFVFYKWFL